MVSYVIFRRTSGPHTVLIDSFEKQTLWCLYWIGLGVLSSVGFGTGLHTFILYLGPHIAAVTLAAHECGSLNFPSPPYPEEIICPEDESVTGTVSILEIMSKVRLEAMMWGAGTALGELPPYFMARTARLSGQSRSQDESYHDGWAKFFKDVVEKAGFFGILAFASIPNPLFDLAGITCGHFLVPFWTFFGATLVGKAVIKMMLQKMFIIVAFNESHFEQFVALISSLPVVGKYLDTPFREFLIKQKASLHRNPVVAGSGLKVSISWQDIIVFLQRISNLVYHFLVSKLQPQSWISWTFEKFVTLMVIYFIISIINSMAQNCLTRRQEDQLKRKKETNGHTSQHDKKKPVKKEWELLVYFTLYSCTRHLLTFYVWRRRFFPCSYPYYNRNQ